LRAAQDVSGARPNKLRAKEILQPTSQTKEYRQPNQTFYKEKQKACPAHFLKSAFPLRVHR